MPKRFVSIWFRHLTTDWKTIRQPDLKGTVFVFVEPDHGRMVITSANPEAEAQGISAGMILADAKAIAPDLQVFDEKAGRTEKLLKGLGEWCIRYTPIVSVNMPDGLMLDVSGCTHIWGGEMGYLKEVVTRLRASGYDARAAMADTIGCAWAIARCGKVSPIIESSGQVAALLPLPPVALRLESSTLLKLQKLGFYRIESFIDMPHSVLRRRFGQELILRLGQATGQVNEFIRPLKLQKPYTERLPCLEPVRTRTAIEIAIKTLLETLCLRLQKDGMGLRAAILTCYRIDGKVVKTDIGTNRPSHHISHIFKLFELKIADIAPGMGIELFVLEATKFEELLPGQEVLFTGNPGLNNNGIAELLDRLAGKIGAEHIHRFLPEEHFWPERSMKPNVSIKAKPATNWRTDKPRPIQLLGRPERIEATAPTPDYPPILFIYKGKRHDVKKADGPERIEREWWLDEGEHRDYYNVEDQNGKRYWLFRSGHYSGDQSNHWFIHGFFA